MYMLDYYCYVALSYHLCELLHARLHPCNLDIVCSTLFCLLASSPFAVIWSDIPRHLTYEEGNGPALISRISIWSLRIKFAYILLLILWHMNTVVITLWVTGEYCVYIHFQLLVFKSSQS